jgi:hypothetical protein
MERGGHLSRQLWNKSGEQLIRQNGRHLAKVHFDVHVVANAPEFVLVFDEQFDFSLFLKFWSF